MQLGIPLIMIFTSGPVNQPTITVVALSKKWLDTPDLMYSSNSYSNEIAPKFKITYIQYK